MTDQLTAMPESFAAGTTLQYLRTLADYPAGTWTLKVYLAGAKTKSADGTASGTDHLVTFSATETAALTPGRYTWVERVTDGSTVLDVAQGIVVVTPDLATATDGSLTSHAERTLAIIEAALEGTLPDAMASFTIAGRSVSTIPAKELFALRRKYQAELAAERAKANGESAFGTVKVRLPEFRGPFPLIYFKD